MTMNTLKIQRDQNPPVKTFSSGLSPVRKEGDHFVLKDNPKIKVIRKEKKASDFLKKYDYAEK